MEAHQCFGHPGQNAMLNLKKRYPELIPNKPEGFHCQSCILSKSTHRTENSRQKRAQQPFKIVHSDLSGKFSVKSLGGKQYYITFIDEFSQYAWVYFFQNKSDTYQAICDYIISIKNQCEKTIKTFFSDNGGEYIDGQTKQFLAENGINHENSPLHEHESNGVAERFN